LQAEGDVNTQIPCSDGNPANNKSFVVEDAQLPVLSSNKMGILLCINKLSLLSSISNDVYEDSVVSRSGQGVRWGGLVMGC